MLRPLVPDGLQLPRRLGPQDLHRYHPLYLRAASHRVPLHAPAEPAASPARPALAPGAADPPHL